MVASLLFGSHSLCPESAVVPSGKKHVALTACEMNATCSKTAIENSARRAVGDDDRRPPMGSMVGPYLGSRGNDRKHDTMVLYDEVKG